MPLFDLLHLGNGTQAIHYFFFCLIAILGTIQCAANRSQRREFLWFEGRMGYLVGIGMVAGGFIWFFLTDEEIFIPGLAGGELFSVFAAAFLVAVPTARVLAHVSNSIRLLAPVTGPDREKEPLI